MVRGPKSGYGEWSSVHYLDSAGLPAAAASRSDPVAQSQLMNELPAFFQAYANSDSAAIGALHGPPGGANRQITVAVIWQLPEQPGSVAGNLGMASKLKMTYGMSVVDLHTGEWYVKEIGASTKAVGAR